MKLFKIIILLLFISVTVFAQDDESGSDKTATEENENLTKAEKRKLERERIKKEKEEQKEKEKQEKAEKKNKEKNEKIMADNDKVNKDEIKLTIFFTNDTNGHPLSFKYMEADGQGGIPARAALIKKLIKEKKNHEILILDAGGIVMGRPESNLYNGETDLAGMNSIGYYASGVGFSELNMTVNEFNDLNKKANFYYLNANVTDENDVYICDKTSIKKIGGFNGINIGLFSVISDDVMKELPENYRIFYKISDPIKSAESAIEELKNDKNSVNIIIGLTYLGYYEDEGKVSSRTLASSIEGIDVIIDGRSGLKFDEPVKVNNTLICQAFKWGLFLGELTLTIKNNEIIDSEYKLHPINYKIKGKFVGEQIEEDQRTLRAIKNKMFGFDKLQKKKIARVQEGSFSTKNIRHKENAIGNIICDSMRDFTGADVAIQNAGGIGDGNIEAGDIDRTSFDNIIKYDNSIVTLNLTGDELIRVLEFGMKSIGRGSFLQVSGVRFIYSKSAKKITEIKVKGKSLDKSAFYKVAINSWLAKGNDGYKIFTQISDKSDLNILHREVLYYYIEKQQDIELFIDGRIKIIE